jgi:hypothetical protein
MRHRTRNLKVFALLVSAHAAESQGCYSSGNTGTLTIAVAHPSQDRTLPDFRPALTHSQSLLGKGGKVEWWTTIDS